MQKEKAILIGVRLTDQAEEDFNYSMEELTKLTETANAEIQTLFTQKREKVDSSWYIGKGKIEEIKTAITELDTDLVIFNNELSPSQKRNIENIFDCKVIDRTQLILDIFAERAESKEGKIQVELAQLNYLLPRLTGKGISMSRLGGGIGTRGPGETKLETDKRHIKKKISNLNSKLKDIEEHRNLFRDRREKNNLFQIALVGYTNAGKSTLLNKLTNANVYSQDKLFATLDSTSKKLDILKNKKTILTDTVGFIKDLPHSLIASFKSTLEEVKDADLILHIIDSSNEKRIKQINVVENLLFEIKANNIPRISVYNKADLIDNWTIESEDEVIFVSAFDDKSLQNLLNFIEEKIISSWEKCKFNIPTEKGNLLDYLNRNGHLLDEVKLNDDGQYWEINIAIEKYYLNKELLGYRI